MLVIMPPGVSVISHYKRFEKWEKWEIDHSTSLLSGLQKMYMTVSYIG